MNARAELNRGFRELDEGTFRSLSMPGLCTMYG